MQDNNRKIKYSGAIGRLQMDIPFELLQWLEEEALEREMPKRTLVKVLLEEAMKRS